MYSHSRLVTSASLIAFGIVIGVGVLALLSVAVETPLVTRAKISDPPATPCKQQTWLHFDRNCLSRHDMPWVAKHRASNDVAVEVPSEADNAPEQSLTEIERTVAVPQEPAQRSDNTAPVHETPVQPPAAKERNIAKPAIESQSRLSAPKKAAHRDRTAKRPPNEALNAVRKFGNTLHHIPASAYAADGTRRRIIIRPTSIQDVYYYSVPR